MPITCHNRVLLLLAFVALAACALPFVNFAPNRLMSGEGLSVWQVWAMSPLPLAISLVLAVVLACCPGRVPLILTLIFCELLFVLLAWSAGLAAAHLATADTPLARTSTGSGLWLWMALCLLACSDAIRRLTTRPV